MSDFTRLLGRNRNYRLTWMGQIVSEVGDHFNNVAVLSLAVQQTHSGGVIAALMLSRAYRPCWPVHWRESSSIVSTAGAL